MWPMSVWVPVDAVVDHQQQIANLCRLKAKVGTLRFGCWIPRGACPCEVPTWSKDLPSPFQTPNCYWQTWPSIPFLLPWVLEILMHQRWVACCPAWFKTGRKIQKYRLMVIICSKWPTLMFIIYSRWPGGATSGTSSSWMLHLRECFSRSCRITSFILIHVLDQFFILTRAFKSIDTLRAFFWWKTRIFQIVTSALRDLLRTSSQNNSGCSAIMSWLSGKLAVRMVEELSLKRQLRLKCSFQIFCWMRIKTSWHNIQVTRSAYNDCQSCKECLVSKIPYMSRKWEWEEADLGSWARSGTPLCVWFISTRWPGTPMGRGWLGLNEKILRNIHNILAIQHASSQLITKVSNRKYVCIVSAVQRPSLVT